MSAEDGSTVAVPKVHGALNTEPENNYFGCACLLVKDFIEGRSVEECWEHLDAVEGMDVVAQVASMVTILQSIPVLQQQPGPVGCRTRLARGIWFTRMGPGPFGSNEELEGWFNNKLAICKKFW